MTPAIYRTSVSIPYSLKEKIKKYPNTSRLITKALTVYFEREKYLESAEQKYWDLVEKSLLAQDGEYISANPNNENITESLLENSLWK